MTSSPVLLAIIALLFIGGGVLIGLALGRGNQKLAKRCQELEQELESARGEFGDYRRQVGQHFDQTGELLRAMTLQYRAVYEHLADGARSLCPDQVTSLDAGRTESLLGSGGAAAAPAPGAADDAAERAAAHEAGNGNGGAADDATAALAPPAPASPTAH